MNKAREQKFLQRQKEKYDSRSQGIEVSRVRRNDFEKFLIERIISSKEARAQFNRVRARWMSQGEVVIVTYSSVNSSYGPSISPGRDRDYFTFGA